MGTWNIECCDVSGNCSFNNAWWSSLHPCWECDCLNNPEIPFAKWVKNIRPSLQGFTRVTQWAECFRTRRRGHRPFTRDNIVNFFLQRPASQSFNCHVGRLEVYVIYKALLLAKLLHIDITTFEWHVWTTLRIKEQVSLFLQLQTCNMALTVQGQMTW